MLGKIGRREKSEMKNLDLNVDIFKKIESESLNWKEGWPNSQL